MGAAASPPGARSRLLRRPDRAPSGSALRPAATTEHRFDLVCGPGLAEQEALDLVTALLLEEVQLGLGFDAFGGGAHAEAGADPGHCPHDCAAILGTRQTAHKHLVDLDLVEAELVQAAEAGIAGAKVVHDDADAK